MSEITFNVSDVGIINILVPTVLIKKALFFKNIPGSVDATFDFTNVPEEHHQQMLWVIQSQFPVGIHALVATEPVEQPEPKKWWDFWK